MTFQELSNKYGSADKISDQELYDFVNSPEVRSSVLNARQLTLENLKKLPLVQEVRRRCKSDLFWMARYFTWETNPHNGGMPIEKNIIDEEHYRVVCDLFVKKDDTKSILEQDTRKSRLLLWPRGGAKSTTDIVDATQWILNFPYIRILFLTAADELAQGFVSELKGHFLVKEHPSLMNLYFPEYCIPEDKQGNSFEFDCPLYDRKSTGRKEPTVYASSVGSNKAGWHYELIKADDAVSDKNTDSEDQCLKISRALFLAEKLLVPGGYFIDYIGTRYNDSDHYGILIEKNVGEIKTVKGIDRPWTLTDNLTTGLRILVGKAIEIKPEVAAKLLKDGKPVKYQEAGIDGCSLLLPHIMPFSWLMGELAKNEEVFEGQLNQNPRPVSRIVFDKVLLESHTIDYQKLPYRGPVSQTWDFAFSANKKRDYCTASNVVWNEKGQMFVNDLIRARFNHTELAKAVVDFAMKWRPYVIGIEDAAGSRFLEPTIIAEAEKTGNPEVIAVCGKIDWIKPDNQKDAKKVRMAALHPWLTSDRLWFLDKIPYLDVLYKEFESCLTSHHHEDIPDVISYQPRYSLNVKKLIESKELQTWSQTDAAYNLMYGPWLTENEMPADAFGRLGFGIPPPMLVEDPEPELKAETPDGIPPVLGAGW